MVCIKKKKYIYVFFFFPLYIDKAICFDFLTEPTGESTNTSSSPTAGNQTILLNFTDLTVSTSSLLLKKAIRFLRLGVRLCLLNTSTLQHASRVFYSQETQKRLKNKAALFIYIIIRSKEMFCSKILKRRFEGRTSAFISFKWKVQQSMIIIKWSKAMKICHERMIMNGLQINEAKHKCQECLHDQSGGPQFISTTLLISRSGFFLVPPSRVKLLDRVVQEQPTGPPPTSWSS